ncbi:hypothetical protein NDU88_004184, partial [Pleurodeles waltl]
TMALIMTVAVKNTYRHGDGRQNTVTVATSQLPYYDCSLNSTRRMVEFQPRRRTSVRWRCCQQ